MLGFCMIDSAFRQGCISDNIQIDETLQYLLYPLVDIDQLSPDGHNLIQDGHDIEICAVNGPGKECEHAAGEEGSE